MKPQSKIAVFLLIAVIGLFSQSITSTDNGSLHAAGHKKNQKEKHDKNQKGKHDKDQKDEKVLMCHTPPGNPANKHEIWVCPDDVQNHLAHGDFLGSCVVAPPDPCVACETMYTVCINGAGGDPEITAACNAEYMACILACGGDAGGDAGGGDAGGGDAGGGDAGGGDAGGGDAGGGDAGGGDAGGEEGAGEEGGGIPDSD